MTVPGSGTGSTLTAPAGPDTATYRRAMGLMPTGVTVITSGNGERTEALTVSSVTSVSLEPILLLISIGAHGRMRRRIDLHGAFTVNVLASGQESLSARFAAHDRPSGQTAQEVLGTRLGGTGNVLVSGALLSVDCRVAHRYPGGDHVIFLGRVESLYRRDGPAAPLVYHCGGYTTLAGEGAY
ncbi:flavin reductase family protein [Streptomyces alkaliphilus]|uniref:flavin reductase family protein n=1 Tax=Streptomyces alkaliphilus TaxID=1472722 RepID=UPI001180765B|nr:flavin reductase family protein [Streptomyces alkaliphilus]MQS06047.1 flavin reductase [Streptomyces alkaliphilus]